MSPRRSSRYKTTNKLHEYDKGLIICSADAMYRDSLVLLDYACAANLVTEGAICTAAGLCFHCSITVVSRILCQIRIHYSSLKVKLTI